jgi:hypothetical protein
VFVTLLGAVPTVDAEVRVTRIDPSDPTTASVDPADHVDLPTRTVADESAPRSNKTI